MIFVVLFNIEKTTALKNKHIYSKHLCIIQKN